MGPIELVAPGEHVSAGDSTLPSRAVAWDTVGQRMWTARDVRSLLDGLVKQGVTLALDRESLRRFLRFGGVGCPGTVFQNISWLGPRDTAMLLSTADLPPKVVVKMHTTMATHTKGTSPSSSENLLLHLQNACMDAVSDTSTLLALSGGKDSLGLALALQKLEPSRLRSVTFATTKDDPDLEIARSIAKRLGFQHSQVVVEGPGMAPGAIQRSARSWSMPCGDPSVLSYICMLEREGEPDGTLLDGTGNDSSFGVVPKSRDRLKVAASRLPSSIRGLIGRAFGQDSRVSLFSRPAHETLLPGHFFSANEVDRLLQSGPVTGVHDSSGSCRDVHELKAIAIGRFFDPHLASLKARLAADGVGMVAKFPWANENLSNYIRALSPEDRIDHPNKRNKVLLRKLLQEKLDYNAQAVGKMAFKNPALAFYRCHRKAVLEEVADCSFFVGEQRNAAIEIVGRLVERLDAHPLRMNALHSLYMLSVWLNHSIYAPNG